MQRCVAMQFVRGNEPGRERAFLEFPRSRNPTAKSNPLAADPVKMLLSHNR